MRDIFIVDTEATDRTPMTGQMPEFGVVHLATRDWFYGRLRDHTPDPNVPARPVVDPHAAVNVYATTGTQADFRAGVSRLPTGAPGRRDWLLDGDPADMAAIKEATAGLLTGLTEWVAERAGRRATFMSDNPAFDFMWIACAYDQAGLPNPFGHSGRRIGDLAAGLSGNWMQTSKWKRLRQTTHDHDPVNDAMGNAEALLTLLARHEQQ